MSHSDATSGPVSVAWRWTVPPGLGSPSAAAASATWATHQVEELVQGVGGQVRGDGVGGADRAGGVGAVDDQVVGGAAGPGGDRPHDRPDLGLGVGPAARAWPRTGRPPPTAERRVAGSSPGGCRARGPALGLGDGRAGADGLLERRLPPMWRTRALVQSGVVGTVTDRSAPQDVGEQIGLGDDLVAEAVVFQAWHRSAARLFAVRP